MWPHHISVPTSVRIAKPHTLLVLTLYVNFRAEMAHWSWKLSDRFVGSHGGANKLSSPKRKGTNDLGGFQVQGGLTLWGGSGSRGTRALGGSGSRGTHALGVFQVRCDPEIQELRQWQKKLREDKHIRERVRLFWAKQEQKGGLWSGGKASSPETLTCCFGMGPRHPGTRAPCEC